VLGLMFVSDNS